MSFDRNPGSIGSAGLFTSGLETVPTSSDRTDALAANEMRDVVYTATGGHSVTVDIGPPTSAGQQDCENPAIRKAFSYTAFCSFNPPAVTLTVKKNLVPSDDPGTFNLYIESHNGNTVLASATGVGHGGDTGAVEVDSSSNSATQRTYRVRETAAGGTNLASYTTTLSCGENVTEGSGSPTDQNGQDVVIGKDATGSLECIITNTRKKGTLKITKNSGDQTGTFSVTATPEFGSAIEYSLDTGSQNPTSVSKDVYIGNYTISETAPDGWVLDSISCVGNGSSGSNAFVVAGEETVCTVINTKQEVPPGTGTVVLKKMAIDGDGSTKFSFSSNTTGLNGVELTPPADGTAETTPIEIAAGAHQVTEILPPGWILTNFSCTNDTHSLNQTTGSFSINGGENIACTFKNKRKRGSLIVRKETIGGDDKFDFEVVGPGTNATFKLANGDEKPFDDTPVGVYTISEKNIPEGWTLKGIDCGNRQGDSTVVNVPYNQTVTCTFVNFKEKDDRMEEVTKLFIHRRVDNLLTHGPDRARLLRRLQEQEQPESLKDGPLKMQGGASRLGMGSSATGAAGSGLGMTGFGMGSAISRAEGPYIGPAGTGMVGAGRSDDPDDANLVEPVASSRMSGFASAAFNQLGNAASGLNSGFKFSASLSELRATMQAIEASKAEEKARLAGELGFGGEAYARPVTGVRQGLDIWVEGQMSRYSDSTGGIRREGDFKILYVGADYALSPRVLVGTLVQFDLTNEDVDDPDLTGTVDGRGWMAGPYIGIKLTDNIIFDARAAWGTSDNDIELYDDAAKWRKGSFDTARWLATASLTGNWYHGPWRLTPQVSLAYGHEEYDTYKNSLEQTVEGAGVSIGRSTFGMEVGYRIMARDGTLVEPHLGITGIWNFDSDDLVIDGTVVETNGSRAKLEGGVVVRRADGMGMRAAVAYDGIGDSDLEALSGQLWLSFPLN